MAVFVVAASLAAAVASAVASDRPVCLYVGSYHPGYEWNDALEQGLGESLDGRCELRRFYMDSKRNPDPRHARRMAADALRLIQNDPPDILIAADDSASRFLVAPFLRDTSLPVVFCGVNWTVDDYGYPYRNATGMVEVAPVEPLLDELRRVRPGMARGVYLSSDVYTEHKDFERYRRHGAANGIHLSSVFVRTSTDWRAAYRAIQDSDADFLIVGNYAGINDWIPAEMARFALEHARLISITNYDWMMPYAMYGMTKLPEEQGHWAGQVAVAVLDGNDIGSIPIVTNRRWHRYMNSAMLDRGGVHLPKHLVQSAIDLSQRP